MPDNLAALGQLIRDADALTFQMFGPLQNAAPTGTFAALLDRGIKAADLLAFFREYWTGIKTLGGSPFYVNIQLHDSNRACERYIEERADGRPPTGSPMKEMPADRAHQIAAVEDQLRMKLATPPSDPAYDPAGIEYRYTMLVKLKTKPLFEQPAANNPGPGIG